VIEETQSKSNASWLTPIRLGVIGSIAASVLYTGSNIQLRSAVGVDPYFVAAVKAIPTVLFLFPVLAFRYGLGKPLATSYAMMPKFIAVAIFGQFVGNAAFSASLEHIGLAIAVPITLMMMILGSALLGRLMLHETVTARKAVAALILLTAIGLLCLTGKPESTATLPDGVSKSIWIGLAYAGTSGATFSLYGVVMRQSLQKGLSQPAAMFISGLVGVSSLGGFSYLRLGLDPILEISPAQWTAMTLAGLLNFGAFIGLTTSYRYLPVVAVNLINTSQVAMAAIAAVLLFQEVITPGLVSGIALTMIGLAILARK
jgi:drug/metabolite transporter, DME family